MSMPGQLFFILLRKMIKPDKGKVTVAQESQPQRKAQLLNNIDNKLYRS